MGVDTENNKYLQIEMKIFGLAQIFNPFGFHEKMGYAEKTRNLSQFEAWN